MAAMSTALTLFSDKENSRTSFYSGHTVTKPHLVLQKRKAPVGDQVMVEDTVTVLVGTVDALGANLDQRCTFSVTVRRPKDAVSADITAALAIIRDIVASDNFANVVTDQRYL